MARMEFKTFYYHTNRITYIYHFASRGIEYEINIEQVTNADQATIRLQDGFTLSKNGAYEVSFDIKANRLAKQFYARALPGQVSAIQVFRQIEKALIAHLEEFNAGMYIFAASDIKLAAIYLRIIKKHHARGNTLESGFKPIGRGYVIRTKYCYR